MKITTYDLSGNGTVTVHQPFGKEVYFAIVEQDGVYPAANQVAENAGRDEYSIVLEGEFTYEINSVQTIVRRGDAIEVPNGSRYRIEGNGSILVCVRDAEGGKTLLHLL